MCSSNAHPQSTGAPEPPLKSSTCFPWMCSASSTKCTCRVLLAWSCSAGDKWSVRSSWWAGTNQNSSTRLDRPGACTVSLKNFFPVRAEIGWRNSRLSCASKLKHLHDKFVGLLWAVWPWVNPFVPLFPCLSSVNIGILSHWYLSEMVWDLQANTPWKVTEIMAVAVLKRPLGSTYGK